MLAGTLRPMSDLPKNLTYEEAVVSYALLWGGVFERTSEEKEFLENDYYTSSGRRHIFSAKFITNPEYTIDVLGLASEDTIDWESVSANKDSMSFCEDTFDSDVSGIGYNLIVQFGLKLGESSEVIKMAVPIRSFGEMIEELTYLSTLEFETVLALSSDRLRKYSDRSNPFGSRSFTYFNEFVEISGYGDPFYLNEPSIKQLVRKSSDTISDFIG